MKKTLAGIGVRLKKRNKKIGHGLGRCAWMNGGVGGCGVVEWMGATYKDLVASPSLYRRDEREGEFLNAKNVVVGVLVGRMVRLSLRRARYLSASNYLSLAAGCDDYALLMMMYKYFYKND
jgi:hypothetical protein